MSNYNWWKCDNKIAVDAVFKVLYPHLYKPAKYYMSTFAKYVAGMLQCDADNFREKADEYRLLHLNETTLMSVVCQFITSQHGCFTCQSFDQESGYAIEEILLGGESEYDIDTALVSVIANMMDRSYALSDISGFIERLVVNYRKSYTDETKLLIAIVFGVETLDGLESNKFADDISIVVKSPLRMHCVLEDINADVCYSGFMNKVRAVAANELENFKKTLQPDMLDNLSEEDISMLYIYYKCSGGD